MKAKGTPHCITACAEGLENGMRGFALHTDCIQQQEILVQYVVGSMLIESERTLCGVYFKLHDVNCIHVN